MTDDVLSSFIDAYRSEHSARSLDRRGLRDRVVAAACVRRVRRVEGLRLLLPFAATFVGSLALAATPPVRERVREAFSFVRSGEVALTSPKASRASNGRAKPATLAPLAVAAPPAAPAVPEIVETPAVVARPLEARPFAPVRAEGPKLSSVAPVPAAAPEPPSPTVTAAPPSASFEVDEPAAPAASGAKKRPAAAAPSANLALYRRAHELHFAGGDRARALSAWDAYLRAFPRGTFAPEARLNRAVCLAKLGRKAEAEGVLTDIERGRFGKDGRRQARKILGALDGDD